MYIMHLLNQQRQKSNASDNIYFPVYSFALQGSGNPQRTVAMRWQPPLKMCTWV